ncbi:spermidine/putrescine-binding protein [Bradyrhizobium sp. F1.13.1]
MDWWKNPYPNLEWALIAVGVPGKDIYNVLGTQEGVDRAFKMLDTIKKDVIWWTAGSQPPQLLADGQVVMTAAFNGRIPDANKKSGTHFEIVWDAAQGGWGLLGDSQRHSASGRRLQVPRLRRLAQTSG